MQQNGNRRSQIVEDYISAAAERDSAILKEKYWLDCAGVMPIKMRTDVATMRLTVHWCSNLRCEVQEMKMHCQNWLNLRYKVIDCEFMQSKDEQRASSPKVTYFHCVCKIPDAVSGR